MEIKTNKFFIFFLFVLPVIIDASMITGNKFEKLPEAFNPVNQNMLLKGECNCNKPITISNGFKVDSEVPEVPIFTLMGLVVLSLFGLGVLVLVGLWILKL